jgi:hypothetical protein
MKRRSRQFRASVKRPNQTTSTQAKGKSSQIKPNQAKSSQIKPNQGKSSHLSLEKAGGSSGSESA